MNKETLRGDWNIVKGKIKEKWGKLTDDDITQINGKKEQLLGALQRKYGFAKEKALSELEAWEKQCDKGCSHTEHHSSSESKHTHKF